MKSNTIFNILSLNEQSLQKEELLESNKVKEEELQRKEENRAKYNAYACFYGRMPGAVNEYTKFNEEVKESLLSEAMLYLFNKSIKTPLYENSEILKKHLINTFIKEVGVKNIIESCYDKSLLLGNYISNIVEYADIITEKAKENNNKDIDSDDKEEFFESLDIEDADDVSMHIQSRVASAINRFNIENMEKRREIENIIQITQSKINNAKTEQLKEHFEVKGKILEKNVRHKTKGIFEAMVYNILESCYKSEDLKQKFFNEDGSPDMDIIIEHTKIMYGFLEMLNTTQLYTISPEYIKEQLELLKIK